MKMKEQNQQQKGKNSKCFGNKKGPMINIYIYKNRILGAKRKILNYREQT